MISIAKKTLVLALTALAIAGCNEQSSSTTSSGGSTSLNSAAVTTHYGQRGADNTWPSVLDAGSSGSITDNKVSANYLIVFDGSGSMEDNGCTNRNSRMIAAKRSCTGLHGGSPCRVQRRALCLR